MAEFAPGDVVVYNHSKNGDERANGSLGVVLSHTDPVGDFFINWLFKAHPGVASAPYYYNLQRIGHVDAGGGGDGPAV